jgi:hypothetical protein
VAPCREATEIVLASEVVGERLLEGKMEEGQSFLRWVRGLLSCRLEAGQTLWKIPWFARSGLSIPREK